MLMFGLDAQYTDNEKHFAASATVRDWVIGDVFRTG